MWEEIGSDDDISVVDFSDSESYSSEDNYEPQISCLQKIINTISWLSNIVYLSNNHISSSIVNMTRNDHTQINSGRINTLDNNEFLLTDCMQSENLSKEASKRHLSAMLNTQNVPIESIITYVQDLDTNKMVLLYKYYNAYTKHKTLYSIYEKMLKDLRPQDLNIRLKKVRDISKRFVEILPVIYLETLQSSVFEGYKFEHSMGPVNNIDSLNMLDINLQTMQAVSDCNIMNELLATNSAVALQEIEFPVVNTASNSKPNLHNLPEISECMVSNDQNNYGHKTNSEKVPDSL
jgi:hypothetical protein